MVVKLVIRNNLCFFFFSQHNYTSFEILPVTEQPGKGVSPLGLLPRQGTRYVFSRLIYYISFAKFCKVLSPGFYKFIFQPFAA